MRAPRDTVPDVDWLWRMFRLAKDAHPADLRDFTRVWRITHTDWAYLLARGTTVGVGHPLPGHRPTLFEVPVDLVPDEPGRWPELVYVCDRRN